MKTVFYILAILVSVGAIYFGMTLSERFENVQSARIVANETNRSVTASAEAADIKIVEEKDLLETSRNNLEVATQSVLALQSTSSALKNEAAKLDTQLAQQDEEFKELDKTLKEVQAAFVDLGEDVNIDNLADKINEIEEDIKVKRAKVEELETLVGGARTNLAARQRDVERLEQRRTARSERISRNAMEARVTAVNHDWGFIVIGAGTNSGFDPQTSLLVTRDGRLIGRVTPSSVEATQTIAEIDPKTLAPGVRIQSGDRVILAKPAGN
jgi:predicted RNase H-like nuclease (RuvC/YqgF family)